MKKFRPSATPLITVDPYFSIWSFSDNLYDDVTHHWTGRRNPMSAGVFIDGTLYYIMGQKSCDSDRVSVGYAPFIPQVSLDVTPTRSVYTFENEIVTVELVFTSPLLMDRADILTRPVSYIEYNIDITDGKEHDTEFYFDISTECAVDTFDGKIICQKRENSVYFGKSEQKVLSKSGDYVCIDWGYIHISEKDAKIRNGNVKRWDAFVELEFDTEYSVFDVYPYVYVRKKELSGVITLGYDSVSSIEYFGEATDDCYELYYNSFDEMFANAISDYDEVKKLCISFDDELMHEALDVSPEYEKLISLSYRQVIAAHKLVQDDEGNNILFSKECHSNGCIGTLDVTYPSIPFFLKFNPDLVNAMLKPIIRFAKTDMWNYDFAPHDLGTFPLANGQVYGLNPDGKGYLDEKQMPVEECGNMLICAAAAIKFGADRSFADENKAILKKWADYLVSYGYMPENQLCTDDFAGRSKYNCNLSIKAILGIASYSLIFGDKVYMKLAGEYASRWVIEASNSVATKLSFDNEASWSIKYNIVWDKLLDINLFPKEVFEKEISLYEKKINKYGVPLDSRADYTKLDWLMWTTVMTDNSDYRNKVIRSIYDFVNETSDRVPMSDYYYTSIGRMRFFQNRSVVGAIYINLL